jgi:SAM-dependent methyltransferase
MTPEVLASLGSDCMILDLGSGKGSFPPGMTTSKIVCCDIDAIGLCDGTYQVRADAIHLPFKASLFDLVIANHSLEHFLGASQVLAEIGRVIKPTGGLYIAVPDGGSVSDGLYRWVASGGGHVNQFTDESQLAEQVVGATSLTFNGVTVLYSGFTFLNVKNAKARCPRKVVVMTGGSEVFLSFLTLGLRFVDRLLQTRLSTYGWALYFGSISPPRQLARTNVCVRCGSAHGADWLVRMSLVRGRRWLRRYNCPLCSCLNFWTSD